MQKRKPDRAMKSRINKRAHDLAAVLYRPAFEDYQRRMLEDSKVIDGHTQPEDWQPLEKVPG